MYNGLHVITIDSILYLLLNPLFILLDCNAGLCIYVVTILIQLCAFKINKNFNG